MSPSQVESKGNKSVVFYLCHSNGQLKTKPKTWQVCVPNADKVIDPITHKLIYDPMAIKTIVFNS